MSRLVEPHGGNGLNPLLLPSAERATELQRAAGLRQVPMTSREVSDVLMLAMGAYTPIEGFMGEADWRGVCLDMKLDNGLFWPIPVTLSCQRELADAIHIEEEVALVDFCVRKAKECFFAVSKPRRHSFLFIPSLTMVVTGLIRPPPEIRAVADRTALYVSKNGRAFEQKILSSSKIDELKIGRGEILTLEEIRSDCGFEQECFMKDLSG